MSSPLAADMVTKVMVWVPYIWGRNLVVTGPTVTRYLIDEATTSISRTRIAVTGGATCRTRSPTAPTGTRWATRAR